MTSGFPLLIILFVLVAGAVDDSSIPAQEAPICGRVIAVSCEGPSSGVTLQLAGPQGDSNWWVVIPPADRGLFGTRIEDRYDDQVVCVAPAAAGTAGRRRVLVRDPDHLVIKETVQPSMALPDDVFRTCDPDMTLPTPVRQMHPRFTVEAMRAKIHGSVYLRGIVDRSGAVRDVHVVQSLEPSLDDASREAFAQWEFRPAMRRGEPVAMAVSVQMTFSMR